LPLTLLPTASTGTATTTRTPTRSARGRTAYRSGRAARRGGFYDSAHLLIVPAREFELAHLLKHLSTFLQGTRKCDGASQLSRGGHNFFWTVPNRSRFTAQAPRVIGIPRRQ
jgi:hypothetical protein